MLQIALMLLLLVVSFAAFWGLVVIAQRIVEAGAVRRDAAAAPDPPASAG